MCQAADFFVVYKLLYSIRKIGNNANLHSDAVNWKEILCLSILFKRGEVELAYNCCQKSPDHDLLRKDKKRLRCVYSYCSSARKFSVTSVAKILIIKKTIFLTMRLFNN